MPSPTAWPLVAASVAVGTTRGYSCVRDGSGCNSSWSWGVKLTLTLMYFREGIILRARNSLGEQKNASYPSPSYLMHRLYGYQFE